MKTIFVGKLRVVHLAVAALTGLMMGSWAERSLAQVSVNQLAIADPLVDLSSLTLGEDQVTSLSANGC